MFFFLMMLSFVSATSVLGQTKPESRHAAEWPVVAPMQQTFHITDPPMAVIKTYVRSPKQKPLYLFIGRAGLDKYYDSLGINYTGDLDCRLIPAERGEVEENLLIERGDLAAWYSRGRMNARELFGKCASYPEYGCIRNFRLRGMQLTIEFLNVQFASTASAPTLLSYDLRLTVKPDPSAITGIAESSGYLDPHRAIPGRSCDTIMKGNEWQR